jgi:hypothetical protein
VRASRMVAAVTAALVAAFLSLGGASIGIAGQPAGKGADNHADNGNGNAYGHEQKPAAPSEQKQAAVPVAKTQTGGSHSTATSGPGNSSQGCDGSHNSDTGHGANHSGPYDNTCDGSPSGNGNGNGKATGKPCAGCVGNADDKNPPGQNPNGTDHNAGYECDRNHGIGRTNPAHSGCTTDNPGEATCPDGSPMTDRNHDGKVNGADCKTDDTPGHHETCPDGSAMTDRNHDGKVNGKDCHDDIPGHEFKCADGSVMTDHNHDGHVDDADCLGDVPGDTDVPVIHNGNPPEVLGLVVEAPTAGTPAVVEGAEVTRKAAASLPFTGSNALNLALIADLIMLVGTLAIWASGLRRSGHESQG